MWTLAWIMTVLLASATSTSDDDPVAVFAQLDGTWAGSFVGYDTEGQELYRIAVRQTYETVSDSTQRVRIEDRMADGTIVTGQGQNVARRTAEGDLELTCRVDKSNGDQVTHRGRLVQGPRGDQQIIWYSSTPDRTETFREHVRQHHGGAVYEINGMGRYGETLILMHGRYQQQQAIGSPEEAGSPQQP
jgi:hypothetical protein